MRVQVDVSVFASPQTMYGYASGEVEVSDLPTEGKPFPWPSAWVAARPSFFAPNQSLVSHVRESEGRLSVQLHGIVCNSAAEAEACASYLERYGGLFVDRYDRGPGENAA